ncbi:hypothetical protein CASFOL_037133 [Castilleja foliolosa]|uniref:Uncharacterized protein n=1 Tax=Castilleja foliolosa TaxID=1961234 RepID=A0ABD3BNA0_9LAMI
MAPPPFTVLPDERDLYRSLKQRDIVPAHLVNVPKWTEDTGEFETRVNRMIENARLEFLLGIREKSYPRMMLEFYTSFRVSGSTIHFRIHGEEKSLCPEEVNDILGIDACARNLNWFGQPNCYFEVPFWDEIRVPGIGKTEGYPFTCVKDNELYFIYRVVTRCIFGKGEPTKITKAELQFLNALRYNQNLRIWPLIVSNLQRVAEVRKCKNSNLNHDMLIALFAKARGWAATAAEERTALDPVELTFDIRLVRNPDKPDSRGDTTPVCEINEYPLRPDPVPLVQSDSDAPDSEGDDDDQPPTDTTMVGTSSRPSRPESSSQSARTRPARPEMNVPTDFWVDWEGWKLENAQEHLGLLTGQNEIRDEVRRQGVTIDDTYRETRRIHQRLDVHESRHLQIIDGQTRLSTQYDQMTARYDQILVGQAEQRRLYEKATNSQERTETMNRQMMEQTCQRF